MYLKDVFSLIEEQLTPDTMIEISYFIKNRECVKRFLYSQIENNQHFNTMIVKKIDYMMIDTNKLEVMDITIHNAYDVEYLDFMKSGC